MFEIIDGTDTSLQIIGFTITASNGGKNDGNGAVVNITYASEYYDQNQQQWFYNPSSATFKDCIFKINIMLTD